MSVDLEHERTVRELRELLPDPIDPAMEESVGLSSLTERYLYSRKGHLVGFYRLIAAESHNTTGGTFLHCLSVMDQYRLMIDGPAGLVSEGILDGPLVLQAISFLLETEDDFPENHPIRRA